MLGLTGLHHEWATPGDKMQWNGSDNRTVESRRCSTVQGNYCVHRTRICRPNEATGECPLSDRAVNQDWEMRVEGPNAFERRYTLAGATGEHEPEAIRRLVLQLIPASPA